MGAIGHAITLVDEAGGQSVLSPGQTQKLNLSDVSQALAFRERKCLLGTSRLSMRRTVVEQILPVPESLVFEADEYLFTLAPAVGDVLVLDKPLTFYRLHSANLYQFQRHSPDKVRRKAGVLEALVQELPGRLAALGITADVIQAILEPVWVEARRLRLSVDGGRRRQVYQVERAASRLTTSEPRWQEWALKRVFLTLALLLPPQTFYRLRRWYSQGGLVALRNALIRPRVSPLTEPK
jgi:hypothetical protein